MLLLSGAVSVECFYVSSSRLNGNSTFRENRNENILMISLIKSFQLFLSCQLKAIMLQLFLEPVCLVILIKLLVFFLLLPGHPAVVYFVRKPSFSSPYEKEDLLT